jgi:hypothetical protein
MSGLDKNRHRNKTVCFRVSPDEEQVLESRIKIAGLPKAEYIIESLLKNGVSIVVGKYQSDRLSLELKKLRESLEESNSNGDCVLIEDLLKECKSLLIELQSVVAVKNDADEMKKYSEEMAKK